VGWLASDRRMRPMRSMVVPFDVGSRLVRWDGARCGGAGGPVSTVAWSAVRAWVVARSQRRRNAQPRRPWPARWASAGGGMAATGHWAWARQ
jgi:hypothetical protein